jgi:hypothetical protein
MHMGGNVLMGLEKNAEFGRPSNPVVYSAPQKTVGLAPISGEGGGSYRGDPWRGGCATTQRQSPDRGFQSIPDLALSLLIGNGITGRSACFGMQPRSRDGILDVWTEAATMASDLVSGGRSRH